jgi:uridine kinase
MAIAGIGHPTVSGDTFINSFPWRHDVLDDRRRGILRLVEEYCRTVPEIRHGTFVIAISGQSGLGKSAFSHQLAHYIGRRANIIDLDCYLLPRTQRLKLHIPGSAPEANDLASAIRDITNLLETRTGYFPYYSHDTGEIGELPRGGDFSQFSPDELKELAGFTIRLLPRDYLILEGVNAFDGGLSQLSNVKILVTAQGGFQLRLMDEVQVWRNYDPRISSATARRKFMAFQRKYAYLSEVADIIFECNPGFEYEVVKMRGTFEDPRCSGALERENGSVRSPGRAQSPAGRENGNDPAT